MTTSEKITVDKAYFDALLRRADFHTQDKTHGIPDPANITISKVEYDSLLRTSREFERLKAALFQGGITADTLDTLISSDNVPDQRKDSGAAGTSWDDDFRDQLPPTDYKYAQPNIAAPYRDVPWRTKANGPTFNVASGMGGFPAGNGYSQQPQLRCPSYQRQISIRMPPSSYPDEAGLDDSLSMGGDEENFASRNVSGSLAGGTFRTLYFSGLSDRTTYRDLLSIVKGGKLLSVTFRSERSATVSFVDGAAEFLAWAKRNDIYLNAKRVEVKWAERQFNLNRHINDKVVNGATRNLVIHGAIDKGLNEQTIREDMEHIHNLVIIDITYRNGDAYVSTNSIHNALYARTCMMSRSTYKGCKIAFYRDECDVPLPQRVYTSKAPVAAPSKRKAPLANRFASLLNTDGTEASSDEENHTPPDETDDNRTADLESSYGVRLDFLDGDSTA